MTEKETMEIVKKENDFLGIIERLAVNPDVDVAKLEKILEMQERILNKNAETEFNIAMSEMQPKIDILKKTKKAHNSNYTPYDEIERQVKPIYTRYGFSLSFNTQRNGETTIYIGTLSHKSGHSRAAQIELPEDTSGSKNAIQARASTISYAKRYLASMLLNIVTTDEDNDGNSFGTISDEKVKILSDLLKETNTEEKNFVGYFGISKISEIKESDYKQAYSLLMQRKVKK